MGIFAKLGFEVDLYDYLYCHAREWALMNFNSYF